MELLAKDVDFLLICLRKVSFGETMTIEHTHTCKDAKEHSYDVDIADFIRTTVRIEPVTFKSKYKVELDNHQVVNMSPIRFKDYIRIMQMSENESFTPEDIKNQMVESLTNVIRSVDEIEDPVLIAQWLDTIKAGWMRQITDHIEVMTDWGPTFATEIECRDCKQKVKVSPPLNPIAFFT